MIALRPALPFETVCTACNRSYPNAELQDLVFQRDETSSANSICLCGLCLRALRQLLDHEAPPCCTVCQSKVPQSQGILRTGRHVEPMCLTCMARYFANVRPSATAVLEDKLEVREVGEVGEVGEVRANEVVVSPGPQPAGDIIPEEALTSAVQAWKDQDE